MTPAGPRRLSDTIAAIATAPGEAAIGVVRVSGPSAVRIAESIFRTRDGGDRRASLVDRRVYYGCVVHPESEEVADEALLVVMRGPRSYTGEDSLELSCHGGPIPLSRVMDAVMAAGARPAGPGEFTRRAFENGKMDLTQAEAVLDLIRARSDKAGILALRQLDGELGCRIERIRLSLLQSLARIEVLIDYPDLDVSPQDEDELDLTLMGAREDVESLLRTYGAGRFYREGVRVAIVGRSNVGKSSLLNALAGRPRAIVTAEPGTTRDIVEETVSLEGMPFILMDTAGMRESGEILGEPERIGMEWGRRAAGQADVLLLVIDETACEAPVGFKEMALEGHSGGLMIVLNKMDVGLPSVTPDEVRAVFRAEGKEPVPVYRVSALTGQGVEELRMGLAQSVLRGARVGESETITLTNARHRRELEGASKALDSAIVALRAGVPIDMVSIDLRDVLHHLDRVTGRDVDTELLEHIFSNFCVGK